MNQVIRKAIITPPFNYLIYSYDYGVELADLFGRPVSFVCPEIERRITEALLADSRITGVGGFDFNLLRKGVVQVSFEVQTIFGSLIAQKEVNFLCLRIRVIRC